MIHFIQKVKNLVFHSSIKVINGFQPVSVSASEINPANIRISSISTGAFNIPKSEFLILSGLSSIFFAESLQTFKAVTGIIVCSVDEQTAKDFIAPLPGELDYDSLRGNQKYRNMDTPDDCIAILKEQFGWHDEQVLTAMWKVTNIITQNAPGEISELLTRLPSEWQTIFDQAPE